MLVPAQQLPISLIGSMWNLISCWSSPEEELYVWEESTELYCNISLMFKVKYLSWKTEKTVGIVIVIDWLCMIHVLGIANRGTCTQTHTLH